MKPHWLIEYREDGRTVGYLRDLQHGDGGLDVYMTRESAVALRFDNEASARFVIDDDAFQRTIPNAHRFFVEGHLDCDGPDLRRVE